jgi:hypothetical protein
MMKAAASALSCENFPMMNGSKAPELLPEWSDRRVVRPDEHLKIFPTKAPVATEQRQNLLSVEERVDGFQGSILVEDDLILEQPGPVKQTPL